MRPTGLDRRDQLRRDVDEILASERNGAITRIAETSSIDFKRRPDGAMARTSSPAASRTPRPP